MSKCLDFDGSTCWCKLGGIVKFGMLNYTYAIQALDKDVTIINRLSTTCKQTIIPCILDNYMYNLMNFFIYLFLFDICFC